MKPWHEDVRRYFAEHLIYDESSDSLCWSDGESVTINDPTHVIWTQA